MRPARRRTGMERAAMGRRGFLAGGAASAGVALFSGPGGTTRPAFAQATGGAGAGAVATDVTTICDAFLDA